MVCLGNICRSPMAEGIMRAKLERAGIAFELDSAGTGNYHIGEHPDHRAVKCMKSKGIDISYLRARQISARDLAHYDIIFTMDESNQKNVLALTNDDVEKQKVRMFLNELHPGKNVSVPDPWFGDEDGFFEVYELLDNAANAFVNHFADAKKKIDG